MPRVKIYNENHGKPTMVTFDERGAVFTLTNSITYPSGISIASVTNDGTAVLTFNDTTKEITATTAGYASNIKGIDSNGKVMFNYSCRQKKQIYPQSYELNGIEQVGTVGDGRFTFNGIGEHVKLSNSDVGDGTGDLTFSNWLNINALGGGDDDVLFTNDQLIIKIVSQNSISISRDGGTTWATSGINTYTFVTWFHLAITSSSTGVSNFYVNGEPVGAADQAAGTPVASSDDYYYGNDSTGTQTINGDGYRPTLVKKILTQGQIKQHMRRRFPAGAELQMELHLLAESGGDILQESGGEDLEVYA
jgi:hypothetical protein